MDEEKKAKLKQNGWSVGTPSEFLSLSETDLELIKLREILAEHLAELRKNKGLNQTELAEQLETDQARISRMENGDPSVSFDATIASLIELGADRHQIGKWLAEG